MNSITGWIDSQIMKKKLSFPIMAATTPAFSILAACSSGYGGHEGNVVEKMAIFSLISLSAFALIAISFLGRK
jgi:hypothetical protein